MKEVFVIVVYNEEGKRVHTSLLEFDLYPEKKFIRYGLEYAPVEERYVKG